MLPIRLHEVDSTVFGDHRNDDGKQDFVLTYAGLEHIAVQRMECFQWEIAFRHITYGQDARAAGMRGLSEPVRIRWKTW
jgi:hypothetical protein